MEMKTNPNSPTFCKESFTPKAKPNQHYEAMVFLGKNQQKKLTAKNGIPSITPFRASVETRITSIAAGIAYSQGLTDKIIFAGGMTGPQSEASLMRNRIKLLFPNIPNTAIIIEEVSLDTTENAKCIKEIFERRKINSQYSALATIGFHTERAKEIFRRQGMEFAQVYSTELMLRDYTVIPHHASIQQIIDKYLCSRRVKLEKTWEKALNILLLFDKNGTFSHLLSRMLRKH